MGTVVCRDLKVPGGRKEPLVLQGEGRSTLAGVGRPAHLATKLSCSMLERQVEHEEIIEEGPSTACACQITQTISHTSVEYRATVKWLELTTTLAPATL